MRKGLWAGAAMAAAMLVGGRSGRAAPGDAPAGGAAAAGPADARFQAIYKAEWDWRMSGVPGRATRSKRDPRITPTLGKVDSGQPRRGAWPIGRTVRKRWTGSRRRTSRRTRR